ncbi:basic amino acid ABC transporter substrate-binding protein [Haloquadratum walsbyi]|jgi:polar amino acid transport system substrate-binding protein|uniref:ABC-type transport system periplasmic substrate-binding protein (Probable substrate glutamine/glutamate/polar amino acids) n=1 Tax=Haloquadratum walsbyi (strain DSM 16854 / JCM 12705 / C23) TaxID=768065 RepID=G0LLR5_HALWC|nr:basic amino acid ABC transporter substrate-binding protein [Haloquadratum walsbyi]CCC40871.1 ABC-type transport system periplasmic substrate-binding protein (probable substrate glutamine/glutamate/polar amino acids) [Haloquadratum walsbyi C23]
MDRRSYIKSGAGVIAGGLIAGCTGSDSESESTATADSSAGTDTPTDTVSDTETATAESVVPSNVVIGSDIPYRPFEYETTSGELTGFDVDIAQAVFEDQLGVNYEFKPTSFDSIIPSLNNGNFRIIMSAMTINDTRDEKVDFSDPYFTAYQTIIVRADSSISSRGDLEGTVVGVQKGTTGANAAEELQSEFDGNIELNRYDQIPAAFQALKNGQVSAVINDNTVNAEFASQEDNIEFIEGEGAAVEAGQDAPPYLTLTVENYGIAFREDDSEFLERVNEALATIKNNGTYDEIYSEYFSG